MKVPEKILCDFCKKEDPRYKNILLPVITNSDWNEGRWMADHIEFERFDVCYDCLEKIAKIRCGFRGSDPTIISTEDNK